MKKVVVILVSFLTFSIVNQESLLSRTKETIIVEKGHGGIFGYDQVNEWHFYDPKCSCEVHKLSCWGSGFTACKWTNPPKIMRLVNYAEEQISNGNLNGSYEEMFDGLRHVVEWNSTDIYNSSITETVYDDSTPGN